MSSFAFQSQLVAEPIEYPSIAAAKSAIMPLIGNALSPLQPHYVRAHGRAWAIFADGSFAPAILGSEVGSLRQARLAVDGLDAL